MTTFNTATTLTGEAYAATITIDASDLKDERTAILFNTTTAEADVKATIAAGSLGDSSVGNLEVDIASVGYVAVSLESARFKNADGNYVITLSSTATIEGDVLVV